MPKRHAVKRVAAKIAHHHVIHRHGDALGVLLTSLAVLIVTILTATVTIRPEFAYFDPETGRTTATYSLEQQPTFYVDAPLFSNVSKEDISAQIIGANGAELAIKPTIVRHDGVNNEFIVSLASGKTPVPGMYTLRVTVNQGGLKKQTEQDFSWGVLALNVTKSSYRPNDKVGLGAAVLDDRGVTLCDAKTSIEIVQPDQRVTTLSTADGSLKVSDTCADKTVTTKPDYMASYVPRLKGEYTLRMTAITKNGPRSIWSSFTVSDAADFVSERHATAMRLYPASSYDVNLTLTANKDFSGTVEERVPHSFSVTNQRLVIVRKGGEKIEVPNDSLRLDIDGDDLLLHWQTVELRAGERLELSYTYKPPFVSPAFYQVGPFKLSEGDKAVFEEPHAWQLASDAAGDVIVLWDSANGAVPAGWTCISCTAGDAFYQLFPRANSTYGASAAGGPESVTHTYTQTSVSTPSAVSTNTNTAFGSRAVASATHSNHVFPSPTVNSLDIKPPYKNLKFIKASNPLGLPANAIAMFDVAVGSLPANWTSYTPLNDPNNTGSPGNGLYLRGENTNTTGGAATHVHTRSSVTSGTATTVNIATGTAKTIANGDHTHTIAAGNTTTENNDPSYITVVFAQNTVANEAIPDGMLAFFDNATLPTGWTQQTTIGGSALANNLIKGSLSAGTVGGSATHDHGGSEVFTSSGPSTTNTGPNAGLTNTTPATNTHTHSVTYSISAGNSMPNYRDVIVGKFATVDITGTVYSDEGTTPLTSVAVKGTVNGVAQRTTTSNVTNGTYTLAMPDPGPGGNFTVWLDTGGGATGATVTRSNGGAASGIDIYQNRLIVAHEDGGPISNTNLGTCDKTSGTTGVCADSDLHFDESSGSLTVDNDWRLLVEAGKTFTPGGNVTLSAGGTAASVGGDLKWGSATSTLNIASNNLSVGGDWINTAGGTFSKATGQTTTMNGTVSGLTIDSSSRNFERLTFNGTGGAWSFTPAATAVSVDGNLTITNGTVTAPSGTLSVGGNWSNAGTFTHNSGTVNFTASSTGMTINSGASSFNNVTFNGSGGAWSALTNTMTVAGNLTVDSGTFDNSSGSANVIVNGNVQGTSGAINMTNNTFTQRVSSGKAFGATSGSRAWTFNNLTFSNSSGTPATITTSTAGAGNIVVTNNLVVSSTGDTAATTLNAGNRTWKLTNTNSANPFDADQAGGGLSGATSTFEYTGNNTTGDVVIENGGYNNLTLGGASAENYTLEGTTTATNDLLINANATLAGAQNMTVNGAVSGAGTVTLTGGIFTQRVAVAENFGSTAGTNDWTFSSLRFENSAATDQTVTLVAGGSGKIITNGTLTIGNATDTGVTTLDNETNDRIIDANGDLTITSKGSLLASSTAVFTIGGSYQNSGSFTAGSGLVTFDATTSGKTLAGGMTGSNKFNNLTLNGSGGAWSFGANSADVGNDFIIGNGSVTAPSTTLTISNNYTNSGTFINNSGLVVFNATTTGRTINAGTSSPFNDVTFNGSAGGWTFQTNAAVINNDLLMIAGTLGSSVNVTVGGNVQCSGTCGTISIGAGTFTQSVGASKSFGTNVATATNWSFNNLTLHATAGTPTITFNGTGTGSTIVAGTLTVSKGAATSQTVDDATNNRIIDANGDVSISSGATFRAPPSASFTVNGSWSNAGTFTHSSGLVTFDATSGTKTIDSGSSSFYDITFNGSGGTWSPQTNTLAIINNLTMTAGTLGAAGDTSDITVNGNVQGSAGVINVTAAGRTFTQRVATSKNFGATSGSAAWNFNNLTFSNSSGTTATITTQTGGSGDVVVAGVLTVSNTGDTSSTTLNAGNRTWRLTNTNQANPFNLDLASGTLTGSTSTFEYTGDNDAGDVTVEDASYNNLTFGGAVPENYVPEGTTNIAGNLLVNGNATLTGTQSMNVNGNAGGAGAVNLSGTSIFTQRVAADQTFGTTSGSNDWVFQQLRFENSSGVSRTVTLNGTGSGAIRTNGLLTIGGLSDTNTTTVDNETNDRTLDANDTFFLRPTGGYTASSTVPLTIGGSYTNNGTFTAGSGEVIFDATTGSKTISAGGTGAGAQFNRVTFNGSAGGWTIQTSDMATVSNLTITDIGSLSMEAGRTLEVRGTYSICGTCTSKTTWTGATLYLNSGTSYTVGTKAQDAETYGTLQVGANTDIRTWRSNATTTTVNASGSLYSQHDTNVLGALSIYGDYHVTGSDYWAYDTDFDGSALGAGSKRQAVVRIETGSGRGVTVDATKNLTIKGGGTGANQFTDVNRIGVSGAYHLTNNGAVTLEDSKVANASFDGGTWGALNTVISGQAVTAGTLTTDWYLAPQVADFDTLSPINTAGADITISETSGVPAATVFKRGGGSWGSAAASQSVDSGADGRIAQPNTDGALRIREYEQRSGTTTYYQYNLTVTAQTSYAAYSYQRTNGKYITSTGNTGSSEDKVIGASWFRDAIATENSAPAINGAVTDGTWYSGISTAILAMWDSADGSIPSGWTCVSCVGGDPFYQRFLRASGTYGGTGGGSETHGHNLSAPSATNSGTFSALTGVTNVASGAHTHSWAYGAGDDTTTADNKPPYKNLQVIRGPASGPLAWPVNIIVPFKTTTAPTGWTAYTALDGRYPRGENTNTTGGATTHTHNSNALSSGTGSGTVGTSCVSGCTAAASATHTHSLAATALSSANNDPLHINVRFMKHSDTSLPAGQDMLSLFDHTSLPSGYVSVSGAAPYQNNLLVGASNNMESTGGSATHNHGGSLAITSSAPIEASGSAANGTTSAATSTHTHGVTYTVDTASSMPNYRDVVVAKYLPNLSPDNPTSLVQKRTTDVVITSSGWTNETSVKFTANAIDPDTTAQQLQLCVEKKPLGVAFTGTEDLCGSAVNETGSAVGLTVTLTGLSAGQYHWQARVKDQNNAYSSWVAYDTADSAVRDFGVDTTAPTTATIYDNTNIETQPSAADADQNADGSLTTLSATWADFDASAAGLSKYEYSIGTAAGTTDIKNWTDNGTTRTIRTGSLSLQTNKKYYVNVRATDNAGNVSSVVSSNGQIVTPTLTFDIDVDTNDIETSPPYTLDFGSLTAASVASSSKKIWVDFDTNGVAGGRVYVAGLNDGLHSTAANYTIASATGNLGTATSGFGAQGATAGQGSGGPFNISSPYNGTSDNVGALSSTFQSIFSSSNPITAGRGSFVLKVKPSSLTPASNDYSETLIIIAAGTY